MQMDNIFNKITIPNYSFFNFSINITHSLFDYLYDNLYIEDTLTWNLRNALTTNANGEYI
jgi:hypothetical protein